MAASQTKHCRKCDQVKPFDAFPKNRRECRQCVKIRKRKWESENREHVNALHRAWSAANQDRHARIKDAWYQRNRENILAKLKQSYESDPTSFKLASRAAYRRDPEGKREYGKSYRAKNFLKCKAHWKNAKARRRNLPNDWTGDDAKWALEYWGGACAACKTPVGLVGACHWDHWIPLIHPHSPGTVAVNMVPLCADCNLTKNRREADEWLKDRFKDKAEGIAREVAEYFQSAKLRRTTCQPSTKKLTRSIATSQGKPPLATSRLTLTRREP